VVQRLNREVNDILAEATLRARFEADGIAVPRNSPAEFADFVKRDTQKYEALVKATGIQAEQ
jgi:tripartite-type tricarboxylate transporter receptor subunit TctC